MTEEKRKRWEEVITSTNMTHNSRKAWKTIRKLSNGPTTSNHPCIVSANQVAHQLLAMAYPFNEEEYRKGVTILKNNKASGRDDVLVEQQNNLGPKAHRWLLTLLSKCFMESKISTLWRQSKIIAILKHGKDSAIPKSYRPISLLCHMYKL